MRKKETTVDDRCFELAETTTTSTTTSTTSTTVEL